MIQIIAHRGLWTRPEEKNTEAAFENALSQEFGIETDFRDMLGDLVVSHDPPTQNAMSVKRLTDCYLLNSANALMALNIKSDGLHELMAKFAAHSKLKNYFVFDMSIPDTLGYIKKGIPFYSRVSEYEIAPVFLEQAEGIWLDCFKSDWYDADLLRRYLNMGKAIAIVSPELHQRPHAEIWNLVKKNKFHLNSMMSICTDFPVEAREFFNAKD